MSYVPSEIHTKHVVAPVSTTFGCRCHWPVSARVHCAVDTSYNRRSPTFGWRSDQRRTGIDWQLFSRGRAGRSQHGRNADVKVRRREGVDSGKTSSAERRSSSHRHRRWCRCCHCACWIIILWINEWMNELSNLLLILTNTMQYSYL